MSEQHDIQSPAYGPGPMGRFTNVLAMLVFAVIAFVVVVLPATLLQQTVIGCGAIVIGLLIGRVSSRGAILTMMAISVLMSSRYLYWRMTSTMVETSTGETVLSFLLLAAECYGFMMLLLAYVQESGKLERRPVPLPSDPAQWPTVDVFVPTYNEPLSVVRATILAAKNLDWPVHKMQIFLLDDGNRSEFAKFAREVGVNYISRTTNEHAKAGNLNNALKHSTGEYVAIFDCDHIPTRSFLQMSMGWFMQDRKLSLVQLPHHFHSPDPFERNLDNFRDEPNEGELFYGRILKGSDAWNATFFCGSCAVLKRDALDEIGGIAVETVTEDAHTALKLQRLGYNTAYIAIPQASGLATDSLSAHVGQRIRWARGMAQIFRIDNPLLGRGLNWGQRLCYTSAMFHFFYGIPRIVFMLAPLWYLFFGAEIFSAPPELVVAYAVPHLVLATWVNSRVQSGHRRSFWGEVYETCLSFYIALPTTVALFNPKSGGFNVTAKGGLIEDDYFERKITLPHLILFALNVIGLGFGLAIVIDDPTSYPVVLMNGVWALYNIILLGGVLAVGWERRQRRKSIRVTTRLPAYLRTATRRTLPCETIDVSLTGAQLRVPRGFQMPQDRRIDVVLLNGDDDDCCVPAQILAQKGDALRVVFDEMSLAKEQSLVRALYSRGDAWLEWREEREDSPMRSAGSIVAHGARAVRRLLFDRTTASSAHLHATGGE